MVDSSGASANLPADMTGNKRNCLGALFILAFPFLVFLAFLTYELNQAPRSGAKSRGESTNAVPPAPAASTNAVFP
jgi:hypothetical protein